MPKITAKITIDLTIMIQVASTNCVSAIGRRSRRDLASSFSISTRTGPPLSRALALPPATPSARKQTPSATRSLICDRGLDAGAVLADADLVAAAAGRGARRRRARSRAAAAGVRNFSGGFSSVIGPAQRSR